MTRTRSLFAAALIALTAPLAISACGSDDGGSDADPQEVIDATLNNDEQITSGVLDISVDASAGDQGSFTFSLNGPFQGVEDDPSAIPQLDLTASVSGEGAGQSVDFEGGLIITDDNAFVEYNGDTYEVGTDMFAQFKDSFEAASAGATGAAGEDGTDADAAASFQEGCAQAIEAQGGDASACEFDVSGWFTDLSNDGTEDVDGTDAVHISGNVDIGQMLDDIVGLAQSIPNAQAVPEEQLSQAEEAISDASFDFYSGADDDLLRKLDLNVSIDPSAIESATPVPVDSIDFGLSVGFSDVNEEQTIEAPADAKPIDELLGSLGGLGGLGALGGLEGLDSGGGSVPGLGGGGGGGTGELPGGDDSQAYLDCVEAAGNDPDAAAACITELQ